MSPEHVPERRRGVAWIDGVDQHAGPELETGRHLPSAGTTRTHQWYEVVTPVGAP